MNRLQLVIKRKEWPDGPEEWAELVDDDKGPYVLYSEANALIGDLRKRLEQANARNRGGYDERKFH